jgi:beta-galactosidase
VNSGTPVAVMLTSYSTTLRANGRDWTRLRIAVTDSLGREITSATNDIRLYLTGDGSITSFEGENLPMVADTGGTHYASVTLVHGVKTLGFRAGTSTDRVKVEARSGTLFPGSHEIHTIPADVPLMTPSPDQLRPATKPIGRMIGADISFLPQIESGTGFFSRGPRGFSEDGKPVDAIQLLKRHGFNAIRLRIFVNPENPKGYAPGVGFCGLDSTLSMARRVKAAGMQLLLDFHYSDYWADPQQQNKPLAWADLDYAALRDTVRSYTSAVLRELQRQGTLPDMVQIGNEPRPPLSGRSHRPSGSVGRPVARRGRGHCGRGPPDTGDDAPRPGRSERRGEVLAGQHDCPGRDVRYHRAVILSPVAWNPRGPLRQPA